MGDLPPLERAYYEYWGLSKHPFDREEVREERAYPFGFLNSGLHRSPRSPGFIVLQFSKKSLDFVFPSVYI